MLFLIRNEELVKDREKTYLTAAIAASATSLTVKAVDTNAWANADWIIIGEIGTKNAEIVQIGAAVSDGTALTVGTIRYAHSINEPVYRIDYNYVRIYRNTTDSTTGLSTLATVEIQPDEIYTRYEDTANSTGYGFVQFRNSASAALSEYSDGIPYSGYTAKSLGRMIKAVRRQLSESDYRKVTDEDIIEEINEKQRDVAHERLWPFYETIFSASTVTNQREYGINTSVSYGKAYMVAVDSEPLKKIDATKYNILHFDTNQTGNPTHFHIWNNKLRLYPMPSSAATSTTLSVAITSATATEISLTSTSGFRAPGRALIDSEVVSYENVSTTQLLGCQRGLEGTIAATHLISVAVTERDIIYTANEEPTELVDLGDETKIPDPMVLVYGSAMELAIGKMGEQPLHDRLKIKYDQSQIRLRGKFGRKGGQFFKIKDKRGSMSDSEIVLNPNDYPENITG